MTTTNTRPDRAGGTRAAILTAAERLFAEQGLFTVSNRQVSEAAGQGNNAAVGYHFGTKTDLIRAIVRRHATAMEQHRRELVERYEGSDDLRDWATVLVRPLTDHLAELGSPSWYARFSAQVMTDPQHRAIVIDDSMASPTTQAASAGLHRCLPEMPFEVRAARSDMLRNLLTHMCADRELELATGGGDPRAVWDATAASLIDALTGMLRAPVS